MKTMFAKWSCGCISLYPRESEDLTKDDNFALIVKACDSKEGELDWFARDMRNETFKPLEVDESKKINHKIAELFADGYSFRTVQRLLNKP